MKLAAFLGLTALCVAAVPSMNDRPWRMGNAWSEGQTGQPDNGHSPDDQMAHGHFAPTNSHSSPHDGLPQISQEHAMPARYNRRKGTEGLRPVLQHDLGGEEEKGKHQLPPFPFIEENRADQPAMAGMPDFTMKEIMQQVQRQRKYEQEKREKEKEQQRQQQENDYSHHFHEEDSDAQESDHHHDHRNHYQNRADYGYMAQYRQYQPNTDTIGHELFMIGTPPRFLLCYEGFDNGTTVMQKSCFTLKTDLQCRPLSELNVGSREHHHISKKHYCMPKTCHSDADCQTVPNPVGSCRSQHGRRGGSPGLARCTIGCSAILFLAACRVSVGADIILERPCHKDNEICTGLFHETLELGSHWMIAHFCHQRDYTRGLTPSPRHLFCPPGHRSHHPVPQLQIPESFYIEDTLRPPQNLGRTPHAANHGPPHGHQEHHNTGHSDDYMPIPESILPASMFPHQKHPHPHNMESRAFTFPVEVPQSHRYGVPSPLQMHHQIPPPDTPKNQQKHGHSPK